MSKKLVVGLALSLVLFSGAFFSARADCCFHWPSCLSLCNSSCSGCGSVRDRDTRDYDRAAIDGQNLRGNNDWERDALNPPNPY
jgi:hypothetical protein